MQQYINELEDKSCQQDKRLDDLAQKLDIHIININL